MKQISNKRTIADVIYDGEQITLKGQVEIDSNTGQVKSVNGDVRLKDGVTYIGNFSMLGININDISYVKYRTDTSELVDEWYKPSTIKQLRRLDHENYRSS